MKFFERFTQEKNKDKSLAAFDYIRQMIDSANVISSNNLLSDDGELGGDANESQKESLRNVIEQLSDDCMDYNNHIWEMRKVLRMSVEVPAGIAATLVMAFTSKNIPDIVKFLPMIDAAIQFGRLMKKTDDTKGTKDERMSILFGGFDKAKVLNEKIKKTLMALRLEKAWIDDNFSDVVHAFVLKKREDTEIEELRKMRLEMGLDVMKEDSHQSLEDILALQEEPKAKRA